jgi:hypothetical protein
MATTLGFPLSLMDPASWQRSWATLLQAAPNYLDQPILPGWTFNINSNNSSSPQTEASVVAKHSYGRQLGRMADALELLIDEQHGGARQDKRFTDFLSMKHEIDEVKRDAAAARLEQIPKDLELLKTHDEAQYARVREVLVQALRAESGA